MTLSSIATLLVQALFIHCNLRLPEHFDTDCASATVLASHTLHNTSKHTTRHTIFKAETYSFENEAYRVLDHSYGPAADSCRIRAVLRFANLD